MPGLLGSSVAAHGLGRWVDVGSGEPLHPHVFQPVDGVAGLEIVLAHKARIGSPVDEVHVLAIGLARGDADHVLLLEPGLYAQRPHAHIGRPAGGVPLLKSDHAGTVLRGRDSRSETAKTGSDYDHIRVLLLHCRTPSICAGLLKHM